MHSATDHKAGLVRIAESPELRDKLKEHLEDVVEGAAFRGSPRCGQFLRYILSQALLLRYDSLKERVIGTEVFGRLPDYDTGEDAIVRVTASDVRRRLLKHYDGNAKDSPFRISLPLGSYAPEVDYAEPPPLNEAVLTAVAPVMAVAEQAVPAAAPRPARRRVPWTTLFWISVAVNVLTLGWLAGSQLWTQYWSSEAKTARLLPWLELFQSGHRTILVPSDPEIAEIQMMQGTQVAVTDYAKHFYINPEKLPAAAAPFVHGFMHGNKSALVDTPIAIHIERLADARGSGITMIAPRSVQFSDLRTDDNFIFLGSPQSNPWTQLFADQLDFRFAYDAPTQAEYIENLHPRPGEQAKYFGTFGRDGGSYAILALVGNPDQTGKVLLLAGLTSEATESAGMQVMDSAGLKDALGRCGLAGGGTLNQHFEMLLHLQWVANYPNHIKVVACHQLP
ncbi:hypothetical protein [Silvibacterium acidisoli]|uniref:hypothetical protein n=1 Tax=Acidobacteriaceae bacterium ZG23-2 TaxID=2883246 RepID=UPI00406CF9AB